MKISGLCIPAMIYFILSIIAIVMSSLKNFNIMYVLIKFFFSLLWSWVLNFLCKRGMTIVSWILLILPFFVMFR
jgi:hypothetical protein